VGTVITRRLAHIATCSFFVAAAWMFLTAGWPRAAALLAAAALLYAYLIVRTYRGGPR
jgi:hypothetical protein